MRKKRLWFYIPLSILIFLAAGFLIWTTDYYKASDGIVAEASKKESVNIKDSDYIVFTPKDKKPTTGLIFYPGAKVDPKAYSPLCSKIAKEGYQVIIVKMPLNLAIFGENRGADVIKKYPEIKNWVIGGHSLGGAMAASFAYKNIDKIKGLVLYASYPQDKYNFSKKNIKVLSLYGSNDKVANLKKVLGAKNLFPKDSMIKKIDGGNHGQFGDYGFQKGDGKSTIDGDEQVSIAAEYTVEFLSEI